MRLSSDDYMQISDLAQKLGITTRTIRLYEQMGLVEAPQRTEGGIRVYEKSDITRFKFVLKLKALGLSLAEMKQLADLYNREECVPDKIMPRLLDLLERHLAAISKRVGKLQSLEKEISEYRTRIVEQYNLTK